MTDTAPTRRRSNSISEYSQIFSQTTPKSSTFIGQKRHPSLSMRHDRTTSFGKLGLGLQGLSGVSTESAIDDSETTAASDLPEIKAKPSTTSDPVGLGRRLSQGARAIMYNGSRIRGESVVSATTERPSAGRTFSHGSSTGASPTPSAMEFATSPTQNDMDASIPAVAAAGKQIKRRMSPTGERMLRGELAFH